MIQKKKKPQQSTTHTDTEKKSQKLGLAFKIIYCVSALAAIIYVIAVISTGFADFFNRYISSGVRAFLGLITSVLPFSLAEILLILLIPAIILAMIIAFKYYCDTWKNVFIFSAKLFSVASILFSLFVFTLGTSYHGSTLDQKLGLDRREVTKDELKYTAELLTEYVNELATDVDFESQSFSVMPYSTKEMNKKLLNAYEKASEQYDFIPKMYSRVKPVMMSKLMSYTHITGVYSFFTGEANINVDFPDYTIPFTAAHELAHQRGVAREDEANFVAFIVCSMSDDTYIRYSGYLSLLEYVSNAYYSADTSDNHTDYAELRNSLNIKVRYEQRAYNEFFDKYRDSVASDVSGAVNDAYLQSQGIKEGSKSYGMVVDLAVAYYKP